MSYLKITIGGKERGLKFNNYALEKVLEKVGESSTMETMYATVYGGLRGNTYAKEEKPDYSFSDVVDWVDECIINEEGQKEIAKSMEVMTETNLYKSLIERHSDKIRVGLAAKKKTVKKRI